MPRKKSDKPKPDFMGVYKKRYNPEVEGYGSPDEWIAKFHVRMGLAQAKETLGKKDPYATLGLTKGAAWKEVKKAYHGLAMKWHPDRNPGDDDAVLKFKEVTAAYEILEDLLT